MLSWQLHPLWKGFVRLTGAIPKQSNSTVQIRPPSWLNLWRKPELHLLPLELDFLYGQNRASSLHWAGALQKRRYLGLVVLALWGFHLLRGHWGKEGGGWPKNICITGKFVNHHTPVMRLGQVQNLCDFISITVSRCQINSFLSFQFKKIQEPAKNPFYLVLLTVHTRQICTIRHGILRHLLDFVLVLFFVPIIRTLSEVNGW